jgi:scyllo-inositol 2-dehydrogenase (NADP+)
MTILVVGGGRMGLSHLAISLCRLGPRDVAVVDSSWPARFVFDGFGVPTFSSIEKAIKKTPEIDGVIVSTPTRTHFPLASMAIQRSIPCFIEKPLTLNVGQSQALVEAAVASNVYTQMGFVLRYIESFQRLRKVAQSGQLGIARRYTARMSGNVITKRNNSGWRTVFANGGGCLNEYGPHLIDICRFAFGEIAEIRSAVVSKVHSVEADDRGEFSWIHSSGCFGEVSLDWCDVEKRKSAIELSVEFDHAVVHVDNSAFKVRFLEGCELSPEERNAICSWVVPRKVDFYLRGEEFSLQLETFLNRCINSKSQENCGVVSKTAATIQDGLQADMVIDTLARMAGLK